MRTSAAGIEQLILEEGEVLRTYRDVAGVLTIGVGLTKSSGVVIPKVGMTISRAESRALLGQALERNYEPAVAAAMPNAKAHEFDGGISFHFNTGAIGRASWVQAWKSGDRRQGRALLFQWNKAGGKVVAGLVARRQREAAMIWDGIYALPAASSSAVLKQGATGDAVKALQDQLRKLGLYAWVSTGTYDAETVEAVRTLQRSHPNLTVDGIAGPATRAALQRQIDLQTKTAATAASGGAGVGGVATVDSASPGVDQVVGMSAWWLAGGILTVMLLVLAYFAWTYRDEIRAKWRQWRR